MILAMFIVSMVPLTLAEETEGKNWKKVDNDIRRFVMNTDHDSTLTCVGDVQNKFFEFDANRVEHTARYYCSIWANSNKKVGEEKPMLPAYDETKVDNKPMLPAYDETKVENKPMLPAYDDSNGKCLNGCDFQNKCLPVGTKIKSGRDGLFCNWNNEMAPQLVEGESCQNNYECESNSCMSGKCMDLEKQLQEQQNLLNKILSWLDNFFVR